MKFCNMDFCSQYCMQMVVASKEDNQQQHAITVLGWAGQMMKSCPFLPSTLEWIQEAPEIFATIMQGLPLHSWVLLPTPWTSHLQRHSFNVRAAFPSPCMGPLFLEKRLFFFHSWIQLSLFGCGQLSCVQRMGKHTTTLDNSIRARPGLCMYIMIMRVKPRVSCTLGKHCTIKLHLQNLAYFIFLISQ